MIRVVMTVWVSSTLALAGVTGAGSASADPWPPSPCGFSITPPQVVQVDGVSKVTATVTSNACGVAASPYQSVACVELAGQQGGSCMQGTDTAQVYFQPYKPGATYYPEAVGAASSSPPCPRTTARSSGRSRRPCRRSLA